MNAFDTSFNFMLKEKQPNSLDSAKKMASDMKRHMSYSSRFEVLLPSTSSNFSQPKKEENHLDLWKWILP